MKRKRDEQPLSHPQPIDISFNYANLPPASKHHLQILLQQWSKWHSDHFPPDYHPPQTESGTLALSSPLIDFLSLASASTAITSHPPSILPSFIEISPFTFTTNNNYELNQNVPQYSRVPFHQSSHLITTKDSRCYNCGSYAHPVQRCHRPHTTTNTTTDEHTTTTNTMITTTRDTSLPRRYFLPLIGGNNNNNNNNNADQPSLPPPPTTTSRSPLPPTTTTTAYDIITTTMNASPPPPPPSPPPSSIQPGQLSLETRRIMGLGPLDPPPWLYRMQCLGIPPAYNNNMEEDKQQQQQPTTTTTTTSKDVGTEYVPFSTNNNDNKNKKKVIFPGVNDAIPDGADPVAWGIIPPPPPPPPPHDALQGSGPMQYTQQQKYHHQYYNYQGQQNQYQPSSSGYDVNHHHYNQQ